MRMTDCALDHGSHGVVVAQVACVALRMRREGAESMTHAKAVANGRVLVSTVTVRQTKAQAPTGRGLDGGERRRQGV